ncbi:MAG: hypothetical protein OXH39_19825 [Candidatus Poribacteria bacterium]|nr:hypothetical protein [Candidatus Poribacteria bacterium]
MKYFQFYLTLCIILLVGCGADNPFSPIEEVSMSEVVNDAINGGDLYENEKIRIKATVLFDRADLDYGGGISLETGYWDVTFFITDYESPKSLNRYRSGRTYTFTLYIEDIEFDVDGWIIWAEEI